VYGYKMEEFLSEGAAPEAVRILDIAAGLVGIIRKGEGERKKKVQVYGKEYARLKPHIAHAGDLIISLSGPPFKCAVAEIKDDEGLLISENLAAARVQGSAPPEYAAIYLNSPAGQRALSRLATGSAGVQKIKPERLEGLEIPAPSRDRETVYALARAYCRREKLLAEEEEVRARVMLGVLQDVLEDGR